MRRDRDRICGIDFGGARDAGVKIWGTVADVADNRLRIERCWRADELPGSGKERALALTALRHYIAGSGIAAFGLDFPFGLPQELLSVGETWVDWVLRFPSDYAAPDAREHKRRTDCEAMTPFSAYNVRLYRQTYYGIREILNPLVRTGSTSVLPMQRQAVDLPWVIEICPASTLKRLGLYLTGYKGKSHEGRLVRERILAGLEAEQRVVIDEPSLRECILVDDGGDALDSVVAALATWKAMARTDHARLGRDPNYAREGYVYV